MKLNKYDFVYLSSAILVSVLLFLVGWLKLTGTTGITASIIYDQQTIQVVDLHQNQTITLHQKDYPKLLGDIEIEVKDGQIRVVEETSPHHFCSQTGFIQSSNESIICLPNYILIKIDQQDTSDVDMEVY